MIWNMQAAHAASVRDLLPLMEDCWCDLLPSIIAEEWKAGQKGEPYQPFVPMHFARRKSRIA